MHPPAPPPFHPPATKYTCAARFVDEKMGRVERGRGGAVGQLSVASYQYSAMVDPVFTRLWPSEKISPQAAFQGLLWKPTSQVNMWKWESGWMQSRPSPQTVADSQKKEMGIIVNTIRKVFFPNPNLSLSLVSKFNKSWLLSEYWGFIKSVYCAVNIIIAFYLVT